MLRHLDLFSGIGGWTLGFHATNQIQTIGFCEIEKFPQAVLKHHYPNIPIFEDIRKLDYERMESEGLFRDGRINILTCSYPCQPFSVAGKKQGEKDKRHLWPEVLRLIKDDRIRPYYVLGENVGGHIRLGLDTVSEDMERSGYRWRCFSIEAACVGANHKRQRVWWIAEDMADSDYEGLRAWQRRSISESLQENDGRRDNKRRTGNNDGDQAGESSFLRKDAEDVADTDSSRCEEQWGKSTTQSQFKTFKRSSQWLSEPNVGRVAHGVPNRVHRLKALGNAIVPQMAYYIGLALLENEKRFFNH